MNALHHLRVATARLRVWAGGAVDDPIGQRLERERRLDGQMFRRHRAFLPWAP